ILRPPPTSTLFPYTTLFRSFRILRNPKGARQLSINADNAGMFLGTLNLLDGMEGGLLTITGDYNDSKESSILTGRVKISEHTVRSEEHTSELQSRENLVCRL